MPVPSCATNWTIFQCSHISGGKARFLPFQTFRSVHGAILLSAWWLNNFFLPRPITGNRAAANEGPPQRGWHLHRWASSYNRKGSGRFSATFDRFCSVPTELNQNAFRVYSAHCTTPFLVCFVLLSRAYLTFKLSISLQQREPSSAFWRSHPSHERGRNVAGSAALFKIFRRAS